MQATGVQHARKRTGTELQKFRCRQGLGHRCIAQDKGVTTAIDVRRMWQEEAVEGLRHSTRPLYEGRFDTMIHDEAGTLYCKCPESGKVRQMSYYGLEGKRGT